ncbi:MAG TPA: MerR family transcriptional regulator [Candidatus Eisenbacteria bacterium]|jgi:DNA-binding transcriptional MerR regulator
MNRTNHIKERRTGLLRIGDLGRLTGKTVRALHLYEELGLLKPIRRTSGGFRLYEAGAIERVRWIDLLNATGVSLHEIQHLVQAWWSAELGPEAMHELRGLFQRKLDQTRHAIRRHQQLERELLEGLSYLETCRVCGTRESVAGCITCQQDHGMPGEPVLVAGLMSSPDRAVRPAARAGFVRVEDVHPSSGLGVAGPAPERSDRKPERSHSLP